MSRKHQRGFVLVTALTLSILYFALMELLLIDSSRALGEAQRFKSHVMAQALAESGAELAAFQIVTKSGATVDAKDFQGAMHGVLKRNSNSFTLEGVGATTGVMPHESKVRVEGRISDDGSLKIDFTVHD